VVAPGPPFPLFDRRFLTAFCSRPKVFPSHSNSLLLIITYALKANVPPSQNLSLLSRQTEVGSSRVCFSVQYAYAVLTSLAPHTVALHGAVHRVVTVGRAVRSGPRACGTGPLHRSVMEE